MQIADKMWMERNPSDIKSGIAHNKGTGTATAVALISKSTLEIADYCIIQSFLMYWFGQYTHDVSQKKLWMIYCRLKVNKVMKIKKSLSNLRTSFITKFTETGIRKFSDMQENWLLFFFWINSHGVNIVTINKTTTTVPTSY